MPPRFAPPEGWVLQAFSFALDPSDEQLAMIARFFGARRK
ncbi:MAG: helix-turn-helix domain-containing protein, partial [Acidimicrobiales bacterium]